MDGSRGRRVGGEFAALQPAHRCAGGDAVRYPRALVVEGADGVWKAPWGAEPGQRVQTSGGEGQGFWRQIESQTTLTGRYGGVGVWVSLPKSIFFFSVGVRSQALKQFSILFFFLL